MLKYLPNALTLLRLLLAAPLGYLILQQQYGTALGIGLVAGITDALDGFAARKLGHLSRFGAALDPVADKTLVTVAFLCLAQVELIPWYVALTIIGRDLVIVTGALCYHLLIGQFEFAATRLSKFNMLVQICFCVILLCAQLFHGIDPIILQIATTAVLLIAIVSGFDYVRTWGHKALQNKNRGD